MERKRNAGVLSEAGCPGVADPGSVVVGMAHTLGLAGGAIGWPIVYFAGPDGLGYEWPVVCLSRLSAH